MNTRPMGLDQQGRYPEAAHAATEVGADEGKEPAASAAVVIVVFALAILAFLASVHFAANAFNV
ncbi:MAG: hypothetical protein IIZ92_03330 [Aquincola sp.]|nr:hypothetical protein [Aquincola sp.]